LVPSNSSTTNILRLQEHLVRRHGLRGGKKRKEEEDQRKFPNTRKYPNKTDLDTSGISLVRVEAGQLVSELVWREDS
jgi:hypothetical protein